MHFQNILVATVAIAVTPTLAAPAAAEAAPEVAAEAMEARAAEPPVPPQYAAAYHQALAENGLTDAQIPDLRTIPPDSPIYNQQLLELLHAGFAKRDNQLVARQFIDCDTLCTNGPQALLPWARVCGPYTPHCFAAIRFAMTRTGRVICTRACSYLDSIIGFLPVAK